MSFVDDKKSDSKPADVRADSLTCNVTPPPLTDAITDENTSVKAKEEVPAERTFEPSGKKDENWVMKWRKSLRMIQGGLIKCTLP